MPAWNALVTDKLSYWLAFELGTDRYRSVVTGPVASIDWYTNVSPLISPQAEALKVSGDGCPAVLWRCGVAHLSLCPCTHCTVYISTHSDVKTGTLKVLFRVLGYKLTAEKISDMWIFFAKEVPEYISAVKSKRVFTSLVTRPLFSASCFQLSCEVFWVVLHVADLSGSWFDPGWCFDTICDSRRADLVTWRPVRCSFSGGVQWNATATLADAVLCAWVPATLPDPWFDPCWVCSERLWFFVWQPGSRSACWYFLRKYCVAISQALSSFYCP